MKLETLTIDNYRVLRDLTLHFERGKPNQLNLRDRYALDFLAGVNGSGKTTALQFLARLFVHLHESDHFAEPFELTYQIDAGGNEQQRITVTNRATKQTDEQSTTK
ncbi:MAG: AAA family ATPase [Caldilineaceae bacterium]